MAEGAACKDGTLQAGQAGGEAGEGPKPEPQLKQMGLGEKVRRQEGNQGVTLLCDCLRESCQALLMHGQLLHTSWQVHAPHFVLYNALTDFRNGAQALRHALLANTVITDLNLECNMLDGKVRTEGE